MNQHLGATYFLSIVIVVAFAVVMSRSEPAPTSRRQLVASRTEPPARSRPKTATNRAREVAAQPAKSPEPLRTALVVSPPEPSAPLVRPISRVRPVARKEIKGAFTTVMTGESLANVAQRVYGSIDAVATLWKANRDQLATPSSALRAGMRLRTP